MSIPSARICSVAQKSERCCSLVGATGTRLFSSLCLAPHTVSSRLIRLTRKASTNPTLPYMNLLFLPTHQTVPMLPFDRQTATFTRETSSKRKYRDGKFSVPETLFGQIG